MVSPRDRLAALLMTGAAVAGAGGCGGGQKRHSSYSGEAFDCKDRRAEYMVTGGFAGSEVGVSLTCIGAEGPRILQWKVVTQGGERTEQTHSIGTDEFDAVWKKIDSTGWRNLGDCDADAGDTDPVYTFGIADNWSTKEISCTATQLPFPYDAIVSELDQKAAEHGE